jgi:hypothetical protein
LKGFSSPYFLPVLNFPDKFDGITTIPNYLNVELRTWIPIDCNENYIDIVRFNFLLKTWENLVGRIFAAGYYDPGDRRPCIRDWIDGDKLNDVFVEVDIHQNGLFGHVVPERIVHSLKPFINDLEPLLLALDNFFWAVFWN